MKTVVIIGVRGVVSKKLQAMVIDAPDIQLAVIETEYFLSAPDPEAVVRGANLVVVCGAEMTSAAVVGKLPSDVRVLDISPTFRCEPDWVYGMLNMSPVPGVDADIIKGANRVANPGCMATAAVVMLHPLLYSGDMADTDNVYLDVTIGYSAGGTKMIRRFQEDDMADECGHSYARVHPHVKEIAHVLGMTGDVVLVPKISTFYSGIRMQMLVPHVGRDVLLDQYEGFYSGTDVEVDREVPNKIQGDEWSGKSGACVRVYQHGASCLVVCLMDNLKKGAVDSAYTNIMLMLDQ